MHCLGCRASPLFDRTGLENLEIIARAGFTKTFLNFWGETADVGLFARRAEKLGVEIDTLHAPFDRINSIWEPGCEGEEFTEVLASCIKNAAEYGIPFVVVHPMALECRADTSKIGIDRLTRTVELAQKLGVRLAFENINLTHPLLLILDTFKTDTVGFCYDTGHEHAFTPGMHYMPIIGERLMTTHLQDNLGIDKNYYDVKYRDDMHRIPFDGNIDFEGICRDFVKYGYSGTLMLEVSNRSDYNFYGGYTSEEYHERAYNAAKRLAYMCEKIKNETNETNKLKELKENERNERK